MKNLQRWWWSAAWWLLTIFSLSVHAADWDPKFRVVTESTSNWYLTVYAEGPGGYNRHGTSSAVINKLTVEVLQSLSATAKVTRTYRTSSSDWYGVYWATGLNGQADGTPMRLVATTNTGKTARSLPFRFRVEQPTLEGQPQPVLPVISSFSASTGSIVRGASVQLNAVFSNGTGRVDPGSLTISSGTPLTVTPTTSTTYTLTVSNSAGTAVSSVTVNVTEPPPPPPPPPSSAQWVSAYYAAYQQELYPPESIDWSGITHIIVTRIKANADGTLNTDFDIGDNGALATRIATLAHQNGRKAILMLGGDDQGAAILSAVSAHRSQFVANLVQAMNRFGFDGIDLDWESDIDWDLFVALARDLRAAAPHAILTVPGGAINGNYMTIDPRVASLVQYLDQYNLMSYYPVTAYAGGGWLSWHNSPLGGVKPATPVSIEDSLDRHVQVGVPRAKLGMGISFYAICYTGGITAPNQPTENGVSILGGDNEYPLSDLFGPQGAYAERYRAWDSAASATYLSLPQPERHGCRYVSYEDEQSILAKGAFSRSHGYGGVIVWTVNQGHVTSHTQPHFLTQALRRGFIEPTAAATVGVSIPRARTYVKPGEPMQFNALVTGTTDKVVTWSVVEPGCGTVDAQGAYAAPLSEATCHVQAYHSGSGITATAEVKVTLATWNPGFHLNRANTCWLEITTDDLTTSTLSFAIPGDADQYFWRHGTEWNSGRPIFASNYCFPAAGGSYRFTAMATDGRSAQADLIVPAYP